MITVEKGRNGECIVHIPQALSVEEVDIFRKEINSRISDGQKDFILDFGMCDFVDSTGLGVIVSAYKKCAELNGTLKLKSLKPNVLKLFHMTRLDRVFEID